MHAIEGGPTFEPVWKPLESAISRDKCGWWMYMFGQRLVGGVTIHAYKHKSTRRYVNFSDDGRAWEFDAKKDGYREISRDTVIARALELCSADEEVAGERATGDAPPC